VIELDNVPSIHSKLIAEPWHECDKCGHKFDESDVQAFLTKDFVYDKHDPEQSIVAHCEEDT
jgi:hypothetical protein